MIKLFKASSANDLFPLASELTYSLLLATFPFLIFLMSLIGYLNIDSAYFMTELQGAMPDSVHDLLRVFVIEVVDVRSAGVLSVSLLVTVFSASSGFAAVMRGINKAYGQKETRNIIHARIISILLVFMLALSIILCIASLVFGNYIYAWIGRIIHLSRDTQSMIGFFGYLITLSILLATIIAIYRFGCSRAIAVHKLIPGAMITLIVWILSSKIFNLYVNNFAKFSKIYGSIAGVFILMYWLNILSIVLLVGAEVNALLDDDIILPENQDAPQKT